MSRPSEVALPSFPIRRILGRPVHDVDPTGAKRWLTAALEGDRCRQVATVNPEFLVTALDDREFAAVLDSVDLALPDGIGLLLAGRWLGEPIAKRATGVDTVVDLASVAVAQGKSLFLLGGAPGVAEETALALRRHVPSLQIAGTYVGSPAEPEAGDIIDRVNASGADALLVAFGAPAQDKWIARHRDRLNVRVAIGVGGTFDYLSGRVPRAPLPVRRAGLEWLFRLIRQPWRWRRMLRLPRFAWRVAREPRNRLKERHGNNRA